MSDRYACEGQGKKPSQFCKEHIDYLKLRRMDGVLHTFPRIDFNHSNDKTPDDTLHNVKGIVIDHLNITKNTGSWTLSRDETAL